MNFPLATEPTHWTGDDWEEVGFDGFESEGIHKSKPTVYRQVGQGRFPPPVEPGTWYRGQLRDYKRHRVREAVRRQNELAKTSQK